MFTYKELLRKPQWQKKRLEILERDSWSCQACGDKDSPLHVHHKLYSPIFYKYPWDYPNLVLITLCESCHEQETILRPNKEDQILQCLRVYFSLDDLDNLVKALVDVRKIDDKDNKTSDIKEYLKSNGR